MTGGLQYFKETAKNLCVRRPTSLLHPENIRDWCISRQLWWGHRIPPWYVCLEGEDECAAGTTEEDPNRYVACQGRQSELSECLEHYCS